MVLIEGPADATDLIDVLVDPETRPPIAILGYRTDGIPGSAMWPFADYSPEYVAARWARAKGRRVEFVDITVGQALAVPEETPDGEAADIEADPAGKPGQPEPAAAGGQAADGATDPAPDTQPLGARVAAEYGYRSFDEFWEAMFEGPAYEPEAFRTALLAWADVVRMEGARD